MEIKASQNKKKPVYPAGVKTVAVVATAAAALAASSCQQQQQQQQGGVCPDVISIQK